MDKPKFYLTRDDEGLRLWFSMFRPKRGKRGIYVCRLAAPPTRVPLSWYDGILAPGECRECDLAEMFTKAKEIAMR